MKRSVGVIVVALVASMTMAGMALAQDGEITTEREMLTPIVFVDEETGTVYVGLPPAEGEDPDECPPLEDVPVEEGPEGEAEGEGEDGELVVEDMRGDCIEFMIRNADGEINHGAIVSAVAKGLDPSTLKASGFKKGEIMRCVAKYGKDDGKHCMLPDDVAVEGAAGGDDGNGDDDVEPKAELDKTDKPGKGNSENARNKDKPNKGKKNR